MDWKELYLNVHEWTSSWLVFAHSKNKQIFQKLERKREKLSYRYVA